MCVNTRATPAGWIKRRIFVGLSSSVNAPEGVNLLRRYEVVFDINSLLNSRPYTFGYEFHSNANVRYETHSRNVISIISQDLEVDNCRSVERHLYTKQTEKTNRFVTTAVR